MSVIQIETANQQRRFRPGAAIDGAVVWELEAVPKSAEVRLFWHTSGRGDEDVEIVNSVKFGDLTRSEQRPFKLQLPEGPYSFSGRLVTLAWAIEIVIEPGNQSSRLDIDVSPWDDDLVLEQAAPDAASAMRSKVANALKR